MQEKSLQSPQELLPGRYYSICPKNALLVQNQLLSQAYLPSIQFKTRIIEMHAQHPDQGLRNQKIKYPPPPVSYSFSSLFRRIRTALQRRLLPGCNEFAQKGRFQRYLGVVFCAGGFLLPSDARLTRNPMHI
jgi:hypothetical protein